MSDGRSPLALADGEAVALADDEADDEDEAAEADGEEEADDEAVTVTVSFVSDEPPHAVAIRPPVKSTAANA